MAWDVAAGDYVFRNAAPGIERLQSPLSYDPIDFRQRAFVIGFVPGLPEGFQCGHEKWALAKPRVVAGF